MTDGAVAQLRLRGWTLAAIFPVCWLVIGSVRWLPDSITQAYMALVMLAFPAEVIAMALVPVWIVTRGWAAFREKRVPTMDIVCAIVLISEVGGTIFGGWEK